MRFVLRLTVLLSCLATISGGGLSAQTVGSVQYPGGYAQGMALCAPQNDGTCVTTSAANALPVGGKQESFALVTANAAAAATTVYGGGYILSQGCVNYNSGALVLRYRGPDGATMTGMVSKNASDSSGGTLVSLGSNAVVDAVLPAGSTGCNVILSRVP